MEAREVLQLVSVVVAIAAYAVPCVGPSLLASRWKPKQKWPAVLLVSIGFGLAFGFAKLAAISLGLWSLPHSDDVYFIVGLFAVMGSGLALSQHANFERPYGYSDATSATFREDEYVLAPEPDLPVSAALDILGLRAELALVSVDDIHRAWRRLASIHHPDRGGDANEFRKVTEARDLLIATVA